MNDWFKIFEDQKNSGMNIARYCIENHISKLCFYNARHRYLHSMNNDRSLSLLPITVIDDSKDDTLDFTMNGIHLEFDGNVEDASLKRILKVCKEL